MKSIEVVKRLLVTSGSSGHWPGATFVAKLLAPTFVASGSGALAKRHGPRIQTAITKQLQLQLPFHFPRYPLHLIPFGCKFDWGREKSIGMGHKQK